MDKDYQILKKQLTKLVKKHCHETRYGADYDDIGFHGLGVLEKLDHLRMCAANFGYTSSWGAISDVRDILDAMTSELETLTGLAEHDVKLKAKVMPIVDEVKKQVHDIEVNVRQQNNINTTYEVAIARRMAEDMAACDAVEEKHFAYLCKQIEPNTDFKINFFRGDEYLLVNDLEKVEELYNHIKKLPVADVDAKEMSEIHRNADRFCRNFVKTVIGHYDELEKLNNKVNKEHKLVNRVNVENLRENHFYSDDERQI